MNRQAAKAASRCGALTAGRYQVRSVPILVVNGKYSTDAPEVGTLQQKLEVADELVERERQRL